MEDALQWLGVGVLLFVWLAGAGLGCALMVAPAWVVRISSSDRVATGWYLRFAGYLVLANVAFGVLASVMASKLSQQLHEIVGFP